MNLKLRSTAKSISSLALSLTLFHSAVPTEALAESFKILGSRPLGMGGAFVAVAEDALAQYWNPAGIARQKKFDLEIPIGARAEFTNGLLKDANTISSLSDKYKKIQNLQQNGGTPDLDMMASLLKTVETLNKVNAPGKGALVEAQGGLNLRIARVAISVNNFTAVGGTPFVDQVNVGIGATPGNTGVTFTGANTATPSSSAQVLARDTTLSALNNIGFSSLDKLTGGALTASGIANNTQLANALVNQGITNGLSDQQILDAANQLAASEPAARSIIQNAASGTSYKSNTSNVTLRGISLSEIAVGYGHRFFLRDLYVGGNLKALFGRVGYYKYQFLQDEVTGNKVSENYDKNSKESAQPGIDLGALYDKRESFRTKFGIVARNINSPKFDQPDVAAGEEKYRVEPQLRAGVAVYPFKSTAWVISSDLDLTNNRTPVPGFNSRFWALGTEFNVVNSNFFNLALRAGVLNNIAEADSKLSYAAGFGLRMLHFFVDASASLSSQTEELKTDSNGKVEKVPQNAQIGISLGLNF